MIIFIRSGKNCLYRLQVRSAYFNYRFGPLEYHSPAFSNTNILIYRITGNAVINYTEADIPFTRIIEHKHFEFGAGDNRYYQGYPAEWKLRYGTILRLTTGKQPTFPTLPAARSIENDVVFGGRLAEYKVLRYAPGYWFRACQNKADVWGNDHGVRPGCLSCPAAELLLCTGCSPR